MTMTRSTIFRFNTLARARAFADRASGPMVVVLGDKGAAAPFWVATSADAARLERAGYAAA